MCHGVCPLLGPALTSGVSRHDTETGASLVTGARRPVVRTYLSQGGGSLRGEQPL
jgi:hypothetical protein